MSKLDTTIDSIRITVKATGDFPSNRVIKDKIKDVMLETFSEALEAKSVAEMGDKFRQIVSEL